MCVATVHEGGGSVERLIVSKVTGEVTDCWECEGVYLFSHGVYESDIKVLLCSDACGMQRKSRNQKLYMDFN